MTVAHVFMDSPSNVKADFYRVIMVSLMGEDIFEELKKSLTMFKVKKRKLLMNLMKQTGFSIK